MGDYAVGVNCDFFLNLHSTSFLKKTWMTTNTIYYLR
jgi:hypothetical protein